MLNLAILLEKAQKGEAVYLGCFFFLQNCLSFYVYIKKQNLVLLGFFKQFFAILETFNIFQKKTLDTTLYGPKQNVYCFKNNYYKYASKANRNTKGDQHYYYFFFRHAQFFPLSFKLHNVHLKTLYVSTQVNVTVWSSSVSDEKF